MKIVAIAILWALSISQVVAQNARIVLNNNAYLVIDNSAFVVLDNPNPNALNVSGSGGQSPADYARAFARLENHYFTNKGFLEYDGQILDQVDRIAHIPATIVQGRYDMICPPKSAYELAQAWPNADLRMVRNAGHALSEPGISAELVRAMDQVGEALT